MASNTFSDIDSLDSLSPHRVEYAQKHILACALYISLWPLDVLILYGIEWLNNHTDAKICWYKEFFSLSDRLSYLFFKRKISTEKLYIYSVIQWVNPIEAIIAINRLCPCRRSNDREKSFPVLSQSLNFCKNQVSNIKIDQIVNLLLRRKYYFCINVPHRSITFVDIQ